MANGGLDKGGNPTKKALSQGLNEDEEKMIAEGAQKAKDEDRKQDEAELSSGEKIVYHKIKELEAKYLVDVKEATRALFHDVLQ